MKIKQMLHTAASGLIAMAASLHPMTASAAPLNLETAPLFVSSTVPPLSMLVMGRDHKLYYEAYNDASDLDGDGNVDVGYKPSIDYYGYFDSYTCYNYSSSSNRFVPQAVTADKKCSSVSGDWSGDFLNYVTTARIDALRKVLYGGYRDIDTSSLTVLQRTHIPQDAHTWGKEYDPAASPLYDIEDYTPLAQPKPGKRHLFANVTLTNTTEPLMRVLNDTDFRVWDWVSRQLPVAGSLCGAGSNCETGAGSVWDVVPSTVLSNLTRKTYDTSGYSGSGSNGHPDDHDDFNDWISDFSSVTPLGSGPMITIQGNDNPFGSNDNYLTVIDGNLTVPADGDYTFSVDGDDAVEFIIRDSPSDHVLGWYGGHGAANNDTHNDTFYLLGGYNYTIQFRHEERGGGDSFVLRWNKTTDSSVITDYEVNVEVCNASMPETNCQQYPNGNYKPTGVLHKYGENDSMMFGLLSGSYENNTQGGVLRKPIGSLTDEINPTNGTLTSTVGIIKTIDAFRVYGFNGGSYNCGWIVNRAISNGECSMWGNPIAEMMYEGMRYFSGTKTPHSSFDYTNSGSIDEALGLPKASWNDPYDTADNGYPYCAKPFQLVISDINPSYDSDTVPGSYFTTLAQDLAIPQLHALNHADTITAGEDAYAATDPGIETVTGMKYIGQSGTNIGKTPQPKDVTSLGKIRGLSPEEPTKQGSYYAASVAYDGWLNDISGTTPEPAKYTNDKDSRYKQRPNTFSVALASPLPEIRIPVANGNDVTLVPFAKSVSGYGISGGVNDFQPTNQIVDFYIESLTSTEGSFLVNFEDVEQGADHDMDALVRYRYKLDASGTVTVTLESLFASGSINQHMGYVISGTTKDGVYLEVRDTDSTDHNGYYLDTPPGVWAGQPRGTDDLPLVAVRTFSPGTTPGASVLKDPLWYAAKWGGFVDQNDDDTPDLQAEWDEDGDGDPDNYFLVTNALGLGAQLAKAFDEILARNGSSATVTVNSGALGTDTLLYQALFDAEKWTGSVLALPVQSDGSVVEGSEVWNVKDRLKGQVSGSGHSTAREILTFDSANEVGIPFRWPADYSNPVTGELASAEISALLAGVSSDQQSYGGDLLNYIRGDDAQEQGVSGATRAFRTREGNVLGDVVHSDPAYVPQPGFFYNDTWAVIGATSAPENTATQKYSDFRTRFKDRKPMLYFGANDGMFHGVNAWADNATGGGQEVLAYVPTSVYSNLGELARPSYSHRYYVDGPTAFGDVFFDSTDSLWHTVAVGSLRGGGQGLFALDITDPHGIDSTSQYSSFDESNASDIVLWEFTDADDADLGYTFGQASLVRMANGKWAALFGNGYNNTEADGNVSTTGNAVVYLVDVEDGSIIKKLDTGVGIADDPTSAGRPNGIYAPTPIDVNGDNIVDYIYAGDLFGNVWKFDVSSNNTSLWKSYYLAGTDPSPLYVAKDASGNQLPITTKLQVSSHPYHKTGHNYMVYFGTGKYIEIGDNSSTGELTQTFHGLWDNGTVITGRSALLQQSITKESTLNDAAGDFVGNFRLVSDNAIQWEGAGYHRGWYMDLYNTENSNTDNFGERQVSNAVIRNGRIIFTTLIPSTDACAAGGTGWLMEMDVENGGALKDSPYDTNNDGVIDSDDLIDTDGDGVGDTAVGGVQPGGEDGGIPSTPAIIDDPDSGNEYKEVGTSTGKIESILEGGASTQKRQSWREVR